METQLSKVERIILHLGRFSPDYINKWDCPYAICQQGIADGLGVVRSNLSRSLFELESFGLLESHPKHIVGVARKRKAYFLTVKGRIEFGILSA
jgi:DNA-binding MarR family transcriptional regulator